MSETSVLGFSCDLRTYRPLSTPDQVATYKSSPRNARPCGSSTPSNITVGSSSAAAPALMATTRPRVVSLTITSPFGATAMKRAPGTLLDTTSTWQPGGAVGGAGGPGRKVRPRALESFREFRTPASGGQRHGRNGASTR